MAILSQQAVQMSFPEPVQRAMANRDALATGQALLDMGAGFRALWIDEVKRPYRMLTPHGVKDATADGRVLREWSMLVPGANLALVLGEGYGAVDVDRDGVDTAAWGVPRRTWSERTMRGMHELVRLSRPARRCKLPADAGDFLTGDASYLAISPSQDHWPVDPDASILTLPDNAPLWDTIQEKPRTEATYAGTVTAQDRDAARGLVERMLGSSDFGPGLAALLAHDPDWPRHFPTATDTTESGRDLQIALAASHHLRYEDRAFEITAALIARCSAKAPRHRRPVQYAAIVATAALTERDRRDAARLDRIRSCIQRGMSLDFLDAVSRITGHNRRPFFRPDPSPEHVLPNSDSPSPTAQTSHSTRPRPPRVIDATSLQGMDRGAALMAFLLGVEAGSEWSGEAGWTRLPVLDLAEVLGCSRETIRRHIVRLEAEGRIETVVHRKRHDGGHRADRWVRLLQS